MLLTMTFKISEGDPCPLIPRAFVDPKRIPKLAREIRKQVRQGEEAAAAARGPRHGRRGFRRAEQVRTAGSRESASSGGVADALAPVRPGGGSSRRGRWAFKGPNARAFVGDGSDKNWDIQQRFFGSFVPILDFIHVLSYVYAAAQVGRDYVCWAGAGVRPLDHVGVGRGRWPR